MNKKVRLVKIGEVGGRKMRLGYVQVRQKRRVVAQKSGL